MAFFSSFLVNLDNILNYVELEKDSGLIEIEPPIIDEFDEYTKEQIKEKMENCSNKLQFERAIEYKEMLKITKINGYPVDYPLLFKAWSMDQQHQHCLGAC